MRTPIFPSPIPEKKPRKIKRSFIEDFPNTKLTKFKRPIFPFAKPVKMHPKPTYAFQNNDLTEPTARPTVWQSPTLRKSNKTAFWFMFCLAAFFTVWSIFLMSILPGIVLDEGNALALSS